MSSTKNNNNRAVAAVSAIGTVLKFAPAPWTRPTTLKSVARPSWIGRVITSSAAPPNSPSPPQTAPPPPSSSRSSDSPPRSNSRPSGSLAALRASVIPPQIHTAREVELEGEVDQLRGEVARLAETIATLRSKILEESEPEILRFCVSIADRIVAKEIEQDPSSIVEWIREGMATLPGREEIVVAVAPDIAPFVTTSLAANAQEKATRVIVDALLPKGSCEVREGTTSAAISQQGRVAAISDALGIDIS